MKIATISQLLIAMTSASIAAGISIPAATPKEILAYEQKNNKSGGGPLQFATPHQVAIDPSTDGVWDSKTNTWTLIVTSTGAKNLNFGFTMFELPEGANLTIKPTNKSKGGTTVKASAKDNSSSNQFWTPIIESDEVLITLEYPSKILIPDPPKDLLLGYINVGFIDFSSGDKSGSCNIDVVCPLSQGWESEVRSVAGISFSGSLFCTGAMINNMRQDATPFFLTANHCGINAGNAASLIPYWNYETSTCGGTPDGVLNQFTPGGAVWLAGSSQSDVTLLRLNNSPDPAYQVSFAGWDNTPSAYQTGPGVCIHHPSGDEKRISFEYDSMVTTSYGGSAISPTGTHVKVIDWDEGTTEPGSSGSPLFNGDHRIIGQLHGGSAACGNDLPDWYGRFSRSWQNSNLATFLDPDNTLGGGNGGIDTYDPFLVPTVSPGPTATPTACSNAGTFSLELNTDDYAAETSWTLTNDGNGNQVASGSGYSDFTTYNIDVCLNAGCYTFTILDSYGDGICCGYGQGSYTVSLDGNQIGSGGQFGSSETVSFCTSSGPPCYDSELDVSYQGSALGCSAISAGNYCSFIEAQSHCPVSCGACSTYGCSDSLAPFVFGGATYTCGFLASQSQATIDSYCVNSAAYTTCRATCGNCAS